MRPVAGWCRGAVCKCEVHARALCFQKWSSLNGLGRQLRCLGWHFDTLGARFGVQGSIWVRLGGGTTLRPLQYGCCGWAFWSSVVMIFDDFRWTNFMHETMTISMRFLPVLGSPKGSRTMVLLKREHDFQKIAQTTKRYTFGLIFDHQKVTYDPQMHQNESFQKCVFWIWDFQNLSHTPPRINVSGISWNMCL